MLEIEGTPKTSPRSVTNSPTITKPNTPWDIGEREA